MVPRLPRACYDDGYGVLDEDEDDDDAAARMPLSLVAQGIIPDAMETLVMADTQEMMQAEDAARVAYEGNPSLLSGASGTMLNVAAGNWVSKCKLHQLGVYI